jgi:hypothetical protein
MKFFLFFRALSPSRRVETHRGNSVRVLSLVFLKSNPMPNRILNPNPTIFVFNACIYMRVIYVLRLF